MGDVLIVLREFAAVLNAISSCMDRLRPFVASDATPRAAEGPDDTLNGPDNATLGDDFLYDTVARMNETVVANIDTADLALLAVVGGTLAVLVFGIDKLRELAPPWEIFAYWLLGASVAVCTSGYLIGFGSQREPMEPGSFAAVFSDSRRRQSRTPSLVRFKRTRRTSGFDR